MVVINCLYENKDLSIDFLSELISSEKYLFHITSESISNVILRSKTILPLTIDGTRQESGLKEKGTSSFTVNPLQIYEEDYSGCFDNKNVVLVFDRIEIVNQGVNPVIYVPEEEIKLKHIDDYRYAPEGADFESEWRSLSEVCIKNALRYIIYVPERYLDVSKNLMKFTNVSNEVFKC